MVESKKRGAPLKGAKYINQLSSHKKSSMIHVYIGDVKTYVCVDTGAARSCIALSLVERIEKLKWIANESDQVLYSAAGEKLTVEGIVEVPLEIDHVKFYVKMYVVPKLYPRVLLGMDILGKYAANISLRTNTLTLYHDSQRATVRFADYENTKSVLSGTYDGGSINVLDDKIKPKVSKKKVSFRKSNSVWVFDSNQVNIPPQIKESSIQPKGILKYLSSSDSENQQEFISKRDNNNNVNRHEIERNVKREKSVVGLNQHSTLTERNMCHCNIAQVSIPDEIALQAKIESLVSIADGVKFEVTRELLQILSKYKNNFDTFAEKIGGNAKVPPIKLEMKDNIPVRVPPYRVSIKERHIQKEIIDEYIKSGIVVKSKSNYSSPALLVRKNSGSKSIKRQNLTKDDLRLCVDYSKVNKHILGSAWPLERTEDILVQLSKSRYYITMDLKSGYHQLKLDEASRNVLAFSTPDGLYAWTVIPFGVSLGPNIFQMTMREIFNDFSPDEILIFLDDFVVHAKTIPQLFQKFEKVMKRVQEVNLIINLKKCQFLFEEINLLGHRVSFDGVKTSPEKIKAVVEYKPPKTVKQIRQFLGLTSYYRKFCRDYAKIAAPLMELTKKDKVFTWSDVEQKAFERLKENLIDTPTLRHFDEELPIILEVDASGIGIGCILSQKEGKTVRPVAYGSRKLSETEQRYPNIEREFLACVYAVNLWRHYLYMKEFEVRTDCHSLIYYKNMKDPSSRLIRFALKLQEYSGMKIVYQPGKKHMAPDALSRAPVDPPEKGKYDEAIPVLSVQDLNLPQLQREDEELSTIFKSLEHPHSVSTQQVRQARRYVIKNEVLYKRGNGDTPDLVMVPKTLINKLIEEHHSNILGGGHLGVRKVAEALSNKYYWRNLEKSVKDFVQCCQHCQYRKGPNLKQKPGLLMPVKVTENIFDKWAIDVCGPFVKSNQGNIYIIAASEYLSGFLVTKPVKTTTSEDICEFMMEIITKYGVPRELISDNGRNFTSNLFTTFLKQMGCTKINTTPYHPQANGMIESNFKSLGNMLALYVTANQKDWDEILPSLTFTLNGSPKETRGGRSPFYILYGVDPNLPIDVSLLPANDGEDLDTRVAKLRLIRENTAKVYNNGKGKQKQRYDENRVKVKFEVSDWVMVYNPRNFKSLSRKLLCRWMGPFEVIEVFNDHLNYRIRDVQTGKVQTVHITRLKKYYPRQNK